jgi:hypothetical protein
MTWALWGVTWALLGVIWVCLKRFGCDLGVTWVLNLLTALGFDVDEVSSSAAALEVCHGE